MRKLRNTLLGLLALLLILIATLSTIIETQAGSRWVVNVVANLAGVQLGDIKGDLHDGLDIGFIDYTEGEQHYRAENISFRWRLSALLYRTVSIQSLQAQRLLIKLPPAVEEKTAVPFNTWPSLGLPVRIELVSINIKNIQYQQGNTQLQWQRLSGALGLGTFFSRYKNMVLEHETYNVNLSGTTQLSFPYRTTAKLLWKFTPAPAVAPVAATPVVTQYAQQMVSQTLSQSLPNNPQMALPGVDPVLSYVGVTDIKGDLRNVQLVNQISEPVVVSATANVVLVEKNNALKDAPVAAIQAAWDKQTLPTAWWVPQQPSPITSGHLTLDGNLKHYRASLTGDLRLPDAFGVAVTAQVNGDLQHIQIDALSLRELFAAMDATANTQNSVAVTAPTVIEKQTEQGLDLNGKISWAPVLAWQLQAKAQQLNLANFFANWPSAINMQFATDGEIKKNTWHGQITDLQLSGHVRDLRLEGGGGAVFDGNIWRSEGLELILGANQLHVKGYLGEKLNLDWNISAPMLGQLDLGGNGSLSSKGQVRGTWQVPQVNMQINAEQFSWHEYALDNLQLTLEPKTPVSSVVEIAPPNKPDAGLDLPIAKQYSTLVLDQAALLEQDYRLNFSTKNLRIANNRLSQITLTGQGSLKKHEVQAVVKSPVYGRTDFTVSGSYHDKAWQGQFEQLAIKVKKVPRWWLTSSKPMRITAEHIDGGNVCLTTRTNMTAVIENNVASATEGRVAEWNRDFSPAKSSYESLLTPGIFAANPVEKISLPQLCLSGNWNAAKGIKLNAKLDSVPLRQFYALFKTEVYFAGVMDGALNFSAPTFALADIQADLDITTRNAELRYQFAGNVTEVYPWKNFALNATLAKGQLDGKFGMEWEGYGVIDATTQLDLTVQKINDGKIHARFSNLAPLETLLSFANDVEGDLRADLSMGGTFSKPYLLGDIQLHNGVVNFPKLGVDVTHLEMFVNSTQEGRISLVSEAQSGKGKVTATAELSQFGSEFWQLAGDLSGKDFEVVNLPQLKATLSPAIKISANAAELHLTGDALIPWARADIKTLPQSATKVSADVVVIDEENIKPVDENSMVLYTNVNLALGDDVHFKGFGLDSKLSGKITLLKEADRQLFTSGFISVNEGNYKAYGQELKIERGRLIFQGPYENPGLDIRASRVIENADQDITVGLEIGNTMQRPVLKVFSVPTRAESEALMMLVTGKPIREASKADAAMLLGAVGGMGDGSSQMVTAEIAEFFRIDEFEIKSDKGIDQSQLWIGKYLTPKLLVRYVVGIFDRAFSLGLRYELTDSLRLEAESGEAQSVDVIYKIER